MRFTSLRPTFAVSLSHSLSKKEQVEGKRGESVCPSSCILHIYVYISRERGRKVTPRGAGRASAIRHVLRARSNFQTGARGISYVGTQPPAAAPSFTISFGEGPLVLREEGIRLNTGQPAVLQKVYNRQKWQV